MTLYISRLSLNSEAPTQSLLALLDPRDHNDRVDAHHRLIWSLFSDSRNRTRDFLWRSDRNGKFYTLSARPPQANDLFNLPETKVFEPYLSPNDRLNFVLRANATRDRAVVSRMDKANRRGKSRRVDVVMELLKSVPAGTRAEQRMNLAQSAARSWMDRQGATKGFSIRTITVEDYRVIKMGRNPNRSVTHGILDLNGEIVINDPEMFLPSLIKGFGRAKAWGCGLMLIRRAI